MLVMESLEKVEVELEKEIESLSKSVDQTAGDLSDLESELSEGLFGEGDNEEWRTELHEQIELKEQEKTCLEQEMNELSDRLDLVVKLQTLCRVLDGQSNPTEREVIESIIKRVRSTDGRVE